MKYIDVLLVHQQDDEQHRCPITEEDRTDVPHVVTDPETEQEKDSNHLESYFSNQQNMTKSKYCHDDHLPNCRDDIFPNIDVAINEETNQ